MSLVPSLLFTVGHVVAARDHAFRGGGVRGKGHAWQGGMRGGVGWGMRGGVGWGMRGGVGWGMHGRGVLWQGTCMVRGA